MVKDMTLVRTMERVAASQGMLVRWEKGAFQGGRCRLDGQEVIILNRQLPIETHLRVLALAIGSEAVNAVPMRSGVRTAIQSLLEKVASTA